jgi:hypothetical protein
MKLFNKLYICLLFFGVSASSIFGQAIVINKVETDIKSISNEELQTKIRSLVFNEDYPFYLNISLLTMSEETMDGIDLKQVVSAELTIEIVDYLNEVSVDQKRFRITSSGKTTSIAQKGLLKSINQKRKDIVSFLKETSETVPALSCIDREKLAKRYIELNYFSQAVAVSRSGDTACTDQLADLRLEIFEQYQQRYCDRHITNAQALLSVKKYDLAISEIIGLSPLSDCKDDLDKILNEIKVDFQQDYSEQFEAYLKVLEMHTLDRQARLQLLDLIQIKQLTND